jgi:hypothetical protein
VLEDAHHFVEGQRRGRVLVVFQYIVTFIAIINEHRCIAFSVDNIQETDVSNRLLVKCGFEAQLAIEEYQNSIFLVNLPHNRLT